MIFIIDANPEVTSWELMQFIALTCFSIELSQSSQRVIDSGLCLWALKTLFWRSIDLRSEDFRLRTPVSGLQLFVAINPKPTRLCHDDFWCRCLESSNSDINGYNFGNPDIELYTSIDFVAL